MSDMKVFILFFLTILICAGLAMIFDWEDWPQTATSIIAATALLTAIKADCKHDK